MKKINNLTSNAVASVHTLTFTIFFIIDAVLNEVLYPFLEKELSSDALRIFITAVIAAFLYSALYVVIKKIYDFVKIKSQKKFDISGKWYHVHIPNEFGKVDYSKDKLRAGEVLISRDMYDFTFVGDNFYYYLDKNGTLVPDHSDDTRWYTKSSKLSDENDFDIIEIYEAQTKNVAVKTLKECPCCRTRFDTPKTITEAEKFRHGIHKYDLIIDENGACKEIRGEFSDCWPSLKCGEIILYRDPKFRDERIIEYFKNKDNIRHSI